MLDIIFQGVGGSVVLAIVVWLLVKASEKFIEKTIDMATTKVESAITRSDEEFRQLLKFGYGVDVDLRKRRIDVYTELWEKTKILSKWPRNPDVTYIALKDFSEALKEWYFEKGGMFLSRTTHNKAYIPLQEAITNTIKQKGGPIYEGITDEEYDRIRELCSNLRTHLTEDIISRKTAPQ